MRGSPIRSGPIQTTVFDSSDGVRSRATASGYSPRVAKSADGKLWFLPCDGVSVIDPRHLPFNKLPPPVHIEQITADRKTYEPSSNLRLPALTRDLEIDYTALSLVAPEKNRFRVKLEGHDRDWKDMGNERKAFYNDLPPRNYRFRVMASNNSGVWNEAGASFDFSIAPAYYQTAWFQALCGIACLALLWGLYRYRLHQIAREFNVRLEERVGERTRIARDLHDTLLQSFQGLMLHLQVVDDLLPQGKAKDELEKTLDRADQAIAEGRTAVYDLRSSATTTNDLAHALREVGNELATLDDSATFRLVVEGPSRDLHPIIRDELYRISREALRNAFSHAHAHHIEAELIYADRQFRLRIRDDGQGIAPAIVEEGRPGHYGLPGMRERARQIGAKLTIWSGVGAGTEIELNLEGSIAYGGTRPGRSRLRALSQEGRVAVIRILAVDDHVLLRDGIAALIANQSDMELVGEASNGHEAIELFRQHRPDVTLMDLQMPEMGGIDALSAIRAEFPEARIIVLTTYAGDVQVFRALKAGARAFLLKGLLRKELLDTIRAVHAGQKRLPPEIAAEIAEHATDDSLTPREIDVLRLIAGGNANKEIAARLSLTEETVKGHVKNILAKLEANDRTHAVTIGLKRGIIEI